MSRQREAESPNLPSANRRRGITRLRKKTDARLLRPAPFSADGSGVDRVGFWSSTDSGASESRYGAGYWDAFRQAGDELEAVLDGREIPPTYRDLPAK
jgi:hypothetical protein